MLIITLESETQNVVATTLPPEAIIDDILLVMKLEKKCAKRN